MTKYFEDDGAVPLDHPALLSIANRLRKRPSERQYYTTRILKLIDAIIDKPECDTPYSSSDEMNRVGQRRPKN